MSSPSRTSPAKSSPQKSPPKGMSLEEKFAAVTNKMGSLDLAIDPSNPGSLSKAKAQLDEIIGDLEEFVEDDLLNDNSEKSKALLADVTELLSQTRVLQGHISKQVTANISNAPASTPADETSDEPELKRDEIAKLLLLVSRAFGISQISVEQRGFLKNEIVNRKGYLRAVVQQEDIGKVLGMLAAISAGK
jgi:hypothetical protein